MDSSKQAIADSFSRSASRYDKAAIIQQQAGSQLLLAMQQHLGEDFTAKVIADIGCGTGYFSADIVACYQPEQYVGVDLAQGMLALAAKNNHHLSNARWLCNDAEDLQLEDQSVDLIYANFSLQWCENLPQLMQSFQRVLALGGVCCFTSLGSNTLTELRQSWSAVDQFNHVNQFYNDVAWQLAIEQAGFSVVHRDKTNTTAYFDSVASALRSLKEIGANVVKGEHRQGLTGKQRFVDFVDTYEVYRTAEGIPVSYEIDSWIIKR
jgi:malonyl-CoA O-methyltransferase